MANFGLVNLVSLDGGYHIPILIVGTEPTVVEAGCNSHRFVSIEQRSVLPIRLNLAIETEARIVVTNRAVFVFSCDEVFHLILSGSGQFGQFVPVWRIELQLNRSGCLVDLVSY